MYLIRSHLLEYGGTVADPTPYNRYKTIDETTIDWSDAFDSLAQHSLLVAAADSLAHSLLVVAAD